MKYFLVSNGVEIILALLFMMLIYCGVKINRSALKHICFNLSAILIGIFSYEIGLSYWPYNQIEIFNDQKNVFYADSPHLGYAPVDSGKLVVNERKSYINPTKLIYEARYTIVDGFRFTPLTDSSHAKNAIFLGGSFAFGQGLNDNETLPYFYGQENRDSQVFNLAFGGYGTHQAYTVVKNGFEDNLGLKNNQETKVFYLFIPAHIMRVNGYAEWDRSGPYYYLKNDELIFGGDFRDKFNKNNIISKAVTRMTQSSDIYKRHLQRFFGLEKGEMELCLRLVEEMNKKLNEKGMEFTVLLEYSSHQAELVAKVKTYLKSHQIQFQDVTGLIPEKKLLQDEFYIKGDNHPTKKYNQTLAKHL